jgi:DnaJ like chaperone protein
VSHLGDDLKKAAEEKFKKVNDAYEKIKKERGIK